MKEILPFVSESAINTFRTVGVNQGIVIASAFGPLQNCGGFQELYQIGISSTCPPKFIIPQTIPHITALQAINTLPHLDPFGPQSPSDRYSAKVCTCYAQSEKWPFAVLAVGITGDEEPAVFLYHLSGTSAYTVFNGMKTLAQIEYMIQCCNCRSNPRNNLKQ